MKPSMHLILIAVFLSMLIGCGGATVSRTDTNAVIDLSGQWNATDSQLVASKMIVDALSASWHRSFSSEMSRRPVVKVGRVVVRAHDDIIDTDIFTNDMIREFINSGQVRAVRSVGDEWQVRDEQKDQDRYASVETRKKAFQETGADYLMTGTIKVQHDRNHHLQQKFYSVDLQLEDITTGELVWLGNHRISKLIR